AQRLAALRRSRPLRRPNTTIYLGPTPGLRAGGRTQSLTHAPRVAAGVTTMMRAGLLRGILAALFMFSAALPGSAEHACEREMGRAAEIYGVPLGVLYAVGLTETGRAGSLRPYALNVEGKPVYAIGKDEALRAVTQARLAGARIIDIGC